MISKPPLIAAALAALLVPAPAGAQDGRITVTLDRSQAPARAGEKIAVRVQIDVPTTPAPGPGERPTPGAPVDPTFSINASPAAGTFAPDAASPIPPWTEMPQYVQVPRSGSRAAGEVRWEFTTGAGAAPGTVIIGVKGGQGSSLLGVPGGSMPVYSGQATLVLTGTPGGSGGGPAARPPGGRSSGAANPTQKMVEAAIAIAVLLGGVGAAAWASTRLRRPRGQTMRTPVPAEPEPAAAREERISSAKRSEAGCALRVVCEERAHEGSGRDCIRFLASAIPSRGRTARIVGAVRWQARVLDPGRYRPDQEGEFRAGDYGTADYLQIVPDPDTPLRAPAEPSGMDHRPFLLRLPWEWRDVRVEFTATASVELTPPAAGPKRGPVTVSGSLTVTLVGANPRLIIAPEPAAVCATGRDGTVLHVREFELFRKPVSRREVRITAVKSVGQTGDVWTHLRQDAAGATWIPPFLLQERDGGEPQLLQVDCTWTGAGAAPVPLPPAPCEVTLLGCRPEPVTERARFVPLAKMKLTAGARLLSAEGAGVRDPLGPGSVRAPGARVTCEVRDLSQGVPGNVGGCRVPPKHPFDGASAAGTDPAAREQAIRAIVAEAPVVSRPGVGVDGEGRVCSPDRRDILLWEYAPLPGLDPIDDGPVVYTLTFEDGLGGTVVLRDAVRTALGSLVMDTGGPEFPVYEYRPSYFDARYEHPLDYYPNKEVTLVWSFALVDGEGRPIQPAGSVQSRLVADRAHTRFDLLVGHMPAGREIYVCQTEGDPADGEARAFTRGQAPAERHAALRAAGWPRVEEEDRARSRRLRRRWHALPEDRRGEEPALGWLATSGSRQWRDRTLALAVRVEMRDGENRLLATSDRAAAAGLAAAPGAALSAGRTSPEEVWRDHRFRYVLLALRLRLEDDAGAPRRKQHYRLEVEGGHAAEGRTADDGRIELIVPPAADDREAEDAKLILLAADGRPAGVEFNLKLGYLDPVSEPSGVEARLNNLGLFASENVTGATTDQFKRAVQRFQMLAGRDPSGTVDDGTREALESAYLGTGAGAPARPRAGGAR